VNEDVMSWGTTVKSDFVYHDFGLQKPQQFSVTNERVQYGRGFHATTLAPGVTYATCSDSTCRNMFAINGKLDGTQDINFRSVSTNWPVMALSYALGAITQTQQPLVFVLGHARDPVVSYPRSGSVVEERSLFFYTSFDNIENAVSALTPSNLAVSHQSIPLLQLSFFIKDYPRALEAAKAFDSNLQTVAANYGNDYYAALAMAARQVLAQVEVTVGRNANGTFNRDDILIFMHGDRTSAIEELYASAPFWLYLNPELLRLLLQPIINEHTRMGISSASQGAIIDLGELPGHEILVVLDVVC
jgi:hypothetical protein